MSKLLEHFDWPAGSEMPGDVELDYFQDPQSSLSGVDHDIEGVDWDMGVWWNEELAHATRTAWSKNEYAVDHLPGWMRDVLSGTDQDERLQLIDDIAGRIPKSEQRVVDHLEAMLSHILRSVSDVSKTPFRLYDARSGVWMQEGDWINPKQVGTSVGSIVDKITRKFAMAMNRGVDLVYEMIDIVAPDPGVKPQGGGQNNLGYNLQQWTAARDLRKKLTDKNKEAHEMVRAMPRGKYRAVKSSLQDRLAIEQTRWDADTRWLVLKDGVLDLNDVHERQEVNLLPFSPFYMSTMALDVAWGAETRNRGMSEWERGVAKIIPDPAVREYLQKRYGAALLGRPGEAGKSMVWQFGVGDTGKSTIQEAIAGKKGVFEPYAVTADAEVLTVKGAERGATDRFIAYARGKRFAIISEIDAGSQLNQGKFKTMTGGETVQGTAKYSNSVTYFFTPTLFVSSNHTPNLPYGDTALSNRIHIVPFTNKLVVRSKVTREEWDSTPSEKRADEMWLHRLLTTDQERASILHWVIDGLMMFGRDRGIGDLPAVMKEASKDFVDEGDPVAKIVNSMLGKDDDSDLRQLIGIYRDSEWEANGWLDGDGVSISRIEELITQRARDLKLTDDFGDLSRRQLTAAKKMLDELGGQRKKVRFRPDANGISKTGQAFARVMEMRQDVMR